MGSIKIQSVMLGCKNELDSGLLMSLLHKQASLAAAWLFPHLAETACSCTAKLHAQTGLFRALAGLGIPID